MHECKNAKTQKCGAVTLRGVIRLHYCILAFLRYCILEAQRQ
jgi:hypothetical protein